MNPTKSLALPTLLLLLSTCTSGLAQDLQKKDKKGGVVLGGTLGLGKTEASGASAPEISRKMVGGFVGFGGDFEGIGSLKVSGTAMLLLQVEHQPFEAKGANLSAMWNATYFLISYRVGLNVVKAENKALAIFVSLGAGRRDMSVLRAESGRKHKGAMIYGAEFGLEFRLSRRFAIAGEMVFRYAIDGIWTATNDMTFSGLRSAFRWHF